MGNRPIERPIEIENIELDNIIDVPMLEESLLHIKIPNILYTIPFTFDLLYGICNKNPWTLIVVFMYAGIQVKYIVEPNEMVYIMESLIPYIHIASTQTNLRISIFTVDNTFTDSHATIGIIGVNLEKSHCVFLQNTPIVVNAGNYTFVYANKVISSYSPCNVSTPHYLVKHSTFG